MPGRVTRSPLPLLVPVFLAFIIAVGWSGAFLDMRQQQVRTLANRAIAGEAVRQSLSALAEETRVLVDVGAFSTVPDELSGYQPATPIEDPDADLAAAEAAGQTALAELRTAGFAIGKDLSFALNPLPPATRQLILGRSLGSLDPAPYARALGALRDALPGAQVDGSQALGELVSEPVTGPLLLSTEWLIPTALVLLLGLISLVRLRGALSGVERRIAGADRGSQRMKELLGSAKRLAAERDEPAMYERLLVEIGELLDADVAAVFSFDGQRAIPVASTGVSDVQPVTSGAGVVGAALASVDAFVAAVALDPAFPTLVSGSMVVAPMIDGHRVTGVLVGGTKTARIMRSEDSNLLQLLAQSVVPIVATLRHHEAAADLVNVDALTGLANRRRLDGDLNGTLRAILSEGQSVAFAMVDVDHFKKFNDTFGHPAGDSLLRQVAEAISAAVRQRDVVYRYGGEEFSVLLPGASPSEARLVAERIRWAVENRQMRGEHGQSVGSVTVSIGLSCRTDLDTSALVAAADSALYRAKHEGRNRVSFG